MAADHARGHRQKDRDGRDKEWLEQNHDDPSPASYMKHFKCSRATATRHLKSLGVDCDKGVWHLPKPIEDPRVAIGRVRLQALVDELISDADQVQPIGGSFLLLLILLNDAPIQTVSLFAETLRAAWYPVVLAAGTMHGAVLAVIDPEQCDVLLRVLRGER